MKIWQFPSFAIQAALFHVPGAAFNAGFSSGGARILSPEPGGFATLEIEPSLQVNEWIAPLSSWIMSKINGDIFHVPLIRTPQLVSNESLQTSAYSRWSNNQLWGDNNQPWNNDAISVLSSAIALEGSNIIKINMSTFGQVLRHGHVIGIGFCSYFVEDIEYDQNNIATVEIKPPLRKNIVALDEILLRPIFTGMISNGGEVRKTYQAVMRGMIQPGRIIFQEVIL